MFYVMRISSPVFHQHSAIILFALKQLHCVAKIFLVLVRFFELQKLLKVEFFLANFKSQ